MLVCFNYEEGSNYLNDLNSFLVAILYCHVSFFRGGGVCGCRGFCHRTESDIFPFLLMVCI